MSIICYRLKLDNITSSQEKNQITLYDSCQKSVTFDDMDNELFLYNRVTKLSKFKIVGLIPSPEFQKCRYMTGKLHVCYPKEYDTPEVRAMLNLDWDEYLTKMKRRVGTPYYLLKSPVAVYLDGELLGDAQALDGFVKEKYRLHVDVDFDDMVEREVVRYFSEIIERQKLYADLVPSTCDNFLSRCTTTSRTFGYKGTKVRRIANYSWIQCGGLELAGGDMPCENYSVPHDRRGVLSMCNTQRHRNNTTQFFICLNPASWMDYNYVAFGQLVQGAEVLSLIEKVPTDYEAPNRKVEIVGCGEFALCPVHEEAYSRALNPPYEALFIPYAKDDDIDSVLSATRYKSGKYFLKTDLRSYLPFRRYSRMFDSLVLAPEAGEKMSDEEELAQEEEEEEEKPVLAAASSSLFRSYSFYQKQRAEIEEQEENKE